MLNAVQIHGSTFLLVASLVTSGLAMGYRPSPSTPRLATGGSAIAHTIAQIPPVPRGQLIYETHRTEIAALVEELHRANIQAAVSALQLIDDRFGEFRSGIGTFAEATTGLGTQLWLAGCYVGDGWDWLWDEENRRAETYINSKFEEFVFSPEDFEALVPEAIAEYLDAVAANRNVFLTKLTILVKTTDLPAQLHINGAQLDDLVEEIDRRARTLATTSGRDCLVIKLASEITGETIVILATPVLMRLAVGLAARAGIGGGSTAASAAAGGGGGSSLGPAGTVGGFVVGVVVGYLIDKWTSDALHADISEKCNAELDRIYAALVFGEHGEGCPEWVGLWGLMAKSNILFKESTAAAVETAMKEVR